MTNRLDTLSDSARWRLVVDAAKQGAREQGYTLSRIPGRGLSNVWKMEKDGKSQVASIRTTRDLSIAFPPLEGGTKWKTLDDVELVVVASVDSKDDPQKIEVYIFPAKEVRKRFNAAYAARAKAGHVQKDNFGIWVALHPDQRGIASSVGSGITEQYKPVAVYSIEALMAAKPDEPLQGEEQPVPGEEVEPEFPRLTTIADVMTWARERVAEIAGVRVEAVKLDLKMEY